MTTLTNFDDGHNLVNQWLEQERNGVQFPVPFDEAWKMAGYSHKGNAMRKLKSKRGLMVQDEDYFIEKGLLLKSDESGLSGRSPDICLLTIDCFKQFCLMAETEQGRQIRQYFIETEKKWKLVEKYRPEIAEEIEVLKMKIELQRLDTEKEQAIALQKKLDCESEQFRYTITQTCSPDIQQKVLGFKEIEVVKYRDRIIKDEDMIRDGSTINKTALCHELGFLTRKGNPDYKALNSLLAQLPSEAFQLSATIRENQELKIEYLPELKRIVDSNIRQLNLGE